MKYTLTPTDLNNIEIKSVLTQIKIEEFLILELSNKIYFGKMYPEIERSRIKIGALHERLHELNQLNKMLEG